MKWLCSEYNDMSVRDAWKSQSWLFANDHSNFAITWYPEAISEPYIIKNNKQRSKQSLLWWMQVEEASGFYRGQGAV